jgi:hypothetical protein
LPNNLLFLAITTFFVYPHARCIFRWRKTELVLRDQTVFGMDAAHKRPEGISSESREELILFFLAKDWSHKNPTWQVHTRNGPIPRSQQPEHIRAERPTFSQERGIYAASPFYCAKRFGRSSGINATFPVRGEISR